MVVWPWCLKPDGRQHCKSMGQWRSLPLPSYLDHRVGLDAVGKEKDGVTLKQNAESTKK